MNQDIRPVYFHDCPALGPHTRLMKGLLTADKAGNIPLGWQYKCPFCSKTQGEIEPYPDAVDADSESNRPSEKGTLAEANPLEKKEGQ